MLTVIFITIIVIVALFIIGGIIMYKSDTFAPLGILMRVIGFFGILAVAIMIICTMKWQVSDRDLTGYIYQRKERFGYVLYSLRFSQNAGEDAQPSFCVAAGSEQDEAMRKLVGKDEKVKVYIPSHHFRFSNNVFECNGYAELNKLES